MDTPHDVTLGAQVQDAPVAVDSVAPPAPPAPAPTPPVVPTSAALVGSVSNASARKFGSTWELKYAISVTERDIATGSPVRAKCLMCEAFDKEVQVGAKRKRTSRIRVFTAPWRPDNMKRHMEQQHPSRWSDYLKLGDNDKCVFFSNPRPLREDSTQPSSAGDVGSVPSDLTPPSSVTAVAGQFRSFLVDKNIVEDLIGDILFGAAGGERRNAWNVPVTFILQEDESLGLDNTGDPNTNRLQPGVDSNESRYIAHVSSLLEFNTCLKYVSMGVSFPQVVSLFQQTAEQTGMDANIEGCVAWAFDCVTTGTG
ncbi:hypothetical protein PHYBOEH_006947 [Phytophthora boehmeriae]|uniref:Uncharacterized protein n=1 Tax=Phytophthora boehmeriae TaxID=109152 RepID=A0A8T1WEE8_9STRA|nr:hypothetical protein PHYBOEH_006947 [Phytophthora boehmeriae]